MPRKKLTDVAVRNLPAPPAEKRQVDYWDTLLGSFGVRVSYNGTKAWVVQPRVLKGGKWTATRITLGRYPAMSLSDAREAAKEAFRVAQAGEDPRQLNKAKKAAMEDASRNTFASIADDFLRKYVARKGLSDGTEREYRRTLTGEDVKDWKNRPIASISRRDVLDMLDSIVERGAPVQANRQLAYLRRFFNWCAERSIIEQPPTDRVKAPAQDSNRDRTLTPAELLEVWNALPAAGPIFEPLFRLLILTGQRRQEVAGMRFDELDDLDGDEPLWSLPGSRTKNGRPHLVPLSKLALDCVGQPPRIEDSPYLFTTTGATPASGFSKAKRAVDDTINKARKEVDIEPMPAWRLHDLRRTMATLMVEELSIDPHIVEAVLNHVSGHRAGVAGVYNRAAYKEQKRRALTAWGSYLDDLSGNKPTNVVHLTPGVAGND